MTATWRARLKSGLLGFVSRLTHRHAVLLSREARKPDRTIDVRAPYRVEGETLTVELRQSGAHSLSATLLGYERLAPTRILWRGPSRSYSGPCAFVFNVRDGTISLGGESWGRAPLPLTGRRFCWRFELDGPGSTLTRVTAHYVAAARDRAIDAEYFAGENYVDHDAQSAGDTKTILNLLRQHGARQPVLEIGCATGGLLAALGRTGLSAVGVDKSSWAVARARERLGPGRAWECDVETEDLPQAVSAAGPFGVLLLPSVFEHFQEPFAVLKKLTPLTATGALLFLSTTNAESLTHFLFADQWEGFFDWTHRGVERVSVTSLRAKLPELGWRLVRLTTDRIWDSSPDPTRAMLREWWDADARFRRLLVERELGDLVTCLAVKE